MLLLLSLLLLKATRLVRLDVHRQVLQWVGVYCDQNTCCVSFEILMFAKCPNLDEGIKCFHVIWCYKLGFCAWFLHLDTCLPYFVNPTTVGAIALLQLKVECGHLGKILTDWSDLTKDKRTQDNSEGNFVILLSEGCYLWNSKIKSTTGKPGRTCPIGHHLLRTCSSSRCRSPAFQFVKIFFSLSSISTPMSWWSRQWPAINGGNVKRSLSSTRSWVGVYLVLGQQAGDSTLVTMVTFGISPNHPKRDHYKYNNELSPLKQASVVVLDRPVYKTARSSLRLKSEIETPRQQ